MKNIKRALIILFFFLLPLIILSYSYWDIHYYERLPSFTVKERQGFLFWTLHSSFIGAVVAFFGKT